MPRGFALIDKSNHAPSTYLCLPVTETNPVSPNRYYHFTLKTMQHLIKLGCSNPAAKWCVSEPHRRFAGIAFHGTVNY